MASSNTNWFFRASGVVVLLVMLWAAIFAENGFIDLMKAYRTVQHLEAEVEAARVENQMLLLRINALNAKDNKEVERLAREDLGMVGDEEIIFQFRSSGDFSDGRKDKGLNLPVTRDESGYEKK